MPLPKVDPEFQVIFEASLQPSQQNEIHISAYATPKRFRLVQCAPLISKTDPILRIVEFNEFDPSRFDKIKYGAISYIWQGNPPDLSWNLSHTASIVVEGARDGDPINIEVLRHACIANTIKGHDTYIWIDRLCIMQTDDDDKSWQIQMMFDIYRASTSTLVLPGGLTRLVRLDEETDWILRAWTLQEVIVREAQMLFSMEGMTIPSDSTLGGLVPNDQDRSHRSCTVHYVVHGISAKVNLKELLKTIRASSGDTKFVFLPNKKNSVMVEARIFGSYVRRMREIVALADATETVWGANNWSRRALWQSSFFRTSKRPVDMVLSIMGLFGIKLDPQKFKSTNRISATIALAQEYLRTGNSAEWIIAGWNEPPDQRLSSFPELPDTSVATPPQFLTEKRDIWEDTERDSLDIRLRFARQAPGGSMDDEGYFYFTAKAARVVKLGDSSLTLNSREKPLQTIQALDDSLWALKSNGHSTDPNNIHENATLYASVLGIANVRGAVKRARAVLLKQHAKDRFHRLAVFFELDVNVIENWRKMDLNMGPVKSSSSKTEGLT
ncbi:heterokaryon incompatibility protein-domain-containing protein [Jackrogersella minutella]|nr:heterokaryon incompatibility protein-domain-containing protein [Jackrogersella minutella]